MDSCFILLTLPEMLSIFTKQKVLILTILKIWEFRLFYENKVHLQFVDKSNSAIMEDLGVCCLILEAYLEPSWTSTMELFAK